MLKMMIFVVVVETPNNILMRTSINKTIQTNICATLTSRFHGVASQGGHRMSLLDVMLSLHVRNKHLVGGKDVRVVWDVTCAIHYKVLRPLHVPFHLVPLNRAENASFRAQPELLLQTSN